MATLDDILTRVNAYLQDDASTPVTAELPTRINFANQSIYDAAAMIRFPQFSKEYVTYATGATVSLPSNFRELEVNPRVLNSSGVWDEYETIQLGEQYSKSSTDKFCYRIGNPAEGYSLIFNNIATLATISVIYQRYPSGMATLTDVCELEDDQYVVAKTASYVLQVFGDERFPMVEQMANVALKNMISRSYKNPGGMSFQTRSTSNGSYKIGYR